MNKPHALSLTFQACSVAVEVSLAHLLSGITAIHGWVRANEHTRNIFPFTVGSFLNNFSIQYIYQFYNFTLSYALFLKGPEVIFCHCDEIYFSHPGILSVDIYSMESGKWATSIG